MPAGQVDRRSAPGMPGKLPTNLTFSGGVLVAIKLLDINTPHFCTSHLREVARPAQEHKWRADQMDFMATYNATIKAEGLPLDELRSIYRDF